jgi:hypothetical protein
LKDERVKRRRKAKDRERREIIGERKENDDRKEVNE